MVEIKDSNGNVLAAGRDYQHAIESCGGQLQNAVLHGVNLDHISYVNIDLTNAALVDVSLAGARLCSANLYRACLTGVNLTNTDLAGTKFAKITMVGCKLHGANLSHSTILSDYFPQDEDLFSRDTILPSFLTYGELIDVVPEMLLAGGTEWEKLVEEKIWACHNWTNCPLHAAFGAESISQVPVKWRPIAYDFMRLFDGGLITLDNVLAAKERMEERVIAHFDQFEYGSPVRHIASGNVGRVTSTFRHHGHVPNTLEVSVRFVGRANTYHFHPSELALV